MKTNKWLNIAVTFLCALSLFAAAFRLMVLQTGHNLLFYILSLIVIYLLLIAAFFLAMFIHEAGHMMAGFAGGFKFSSFNILGWQLHTQQNRLKVSRRSLSGAAGQCLMVPESVQADFSRYNAGGWMANLAAGLLCALLLLIFKNPWVQFFLMCLAICNLYLAMVNGLPLQIGNGLCNDGYNSAFMKDPGITQALYDQMHINQVLQEGKTMGELDSQWLKDYPAHQLDNPLLMQAQLMLENYYFYENQPEKARQQIKKLLGLKELPGCLKGPLILDQLYYALQDGQLKKAGQLEQDPDLRLFMKQNPKDPPVLRTQALFAARVEKNPLRAGKLKEAFEKSIRQYPYPGLARQEQELMDQLF